MEDDLEDQIIKKTNLADIVIKRIRTSISNGELKPGDKLPSHDELCKTWGISLTTIREALNKLESMGLLMKKQGKGTFITEIQPNQILPTKELGQLLSKSGVLELLEARRYLETAAAELAAIRRSDEDAIILEEIYHQMEKEISDNEHARFAEQDQRFHLLISKMSKNSFIVLMMKAIQNSLAIQQLEILSIKGYEQKRIAATSQDFHKKIMNAIQDMNPEKAKNNMILHLKSIQEFIEKNQ